VKKKIEDFIKEQNNKKFLLTAGPASLIKENILGISPCFGRGDNQYLKVEKKVLNKLKNISGHNKIARMQGSGSFALEVVALNFLYGRVLVISTGYYSERLYSLCNKAKKNFKKIKKIKKIDWKNLDDFSGNFDWVWACPTETSCGLKIPITELKKFSKKIKAKLALDATASMGLEPFHDLADVISYSSCKGLFGLTGACFVAYNSKPQNKVDSFNLDINSHIEKKMTGPYHAIQSLEKVLEKHSYFSYAVKINKIKFLKKFHNNLIYNNKNQPLLCTYTDCKIITKEKKVIFYKPRINLPGSVICHLGEVHLGKFSKGKILDKIYIKKNN
jgi:aspartate aminotransferase-like enzyme